MLRDWLCAVMIAEAGVSNAHDLSFDTAAADDDPSQVYLALRWVKPTPSGPAGL